jgi:hypothetical protein
MRRLVLALLAAAAAGPAAADCTCRSPTGDPRPLGADICMTADGAPATYRCSMVQNLTSWRKIRDGCPQAARTPPAPGENHPDEPPVRFASNAE